MPRGTALALQGSTLAPGAADEYFGFCSGGAASSSSLVPKHRRAGGSKAASSFLDSLSGALPLHTQSASRQRAAMSAFLGAAAQPSPSLWGADDENSSSCFDCACSTVYDINKKPSRTRVVLPNVPHHTFIGHEKNLGLSWKFLTFLWILGAGLGYTIMLGVKSVVYEDKSLAFKAQGGQSIMPEGEEGEEEESEPESSDEDQEEDEDDNEA
mmetsp:Transcript_52116/g.124136  ORF Transcript_52116/g.124136 Transcript_52116/m.124136 type:complete len:212 (-) Transcript_52116:71-706(-)